MKSKLRIAVIAYFSLTLFIPTLSYGENKINNGSREANSAIETLSPELRELLIKEMQALQNGMMAIIPAYVSGNWPEIESIAQQMKNSYILKTAIF